SLTGTVVALALVGAAVPARAEVVRHTLDGDQVAIHNLIGEFTVVPTQGSAVVAEVTLRGRDADRLEVREGLLRGKTTLRIIYPGNRIVLPEASSEGRSWKGWGHRWQSNFWVREDGTLDGKSGEGHRVTVSDRGSGLSAAADVRLLVPRGRSVAVYWVHGTGDVTGVAANVAIDGAGLEVTARDVKGALSVDVGSGTVKISDAVLNLSVDTGSGDVTLSNIRGERVNIDTGSGAIDAHDIVGREVSLDTGSGDIRAEGIRVPRVHVDTGSGSVQIAIESDVEALAVDTGSGNVSIRVPSGVGASFRAETGSGRISSDLPLDLTKRSSGYLAGTLGDGRGRIALETGSGDISLKRGL
ncbi:MAG TPA: DUF4097 family beta strand repeat-containing protein, partial [Candidatus Eisenbacteria bacterium]|nr:DUF4097 family beta strand repeat-containing protein [Candidatus Eisenbacteria bacterium]